MADCFYGPDALFIDEILAVDRDQGMVQAQMPTPDTLPLTRDQRGDPRVHPRHVAAAVMLHVTGIVGYAHAYYVLDVRHAEGWVGFGTHIHSARFRAMCVLGPPVVVECRQQRIRKLVGNLFARYQYVFKQNGETIYESEQSAVWRRP